MSERLTEGDIKITKEFTRLDTVRDDDYYNAFRRELNPHSHSKVKNEGIIIYFDIFDFSEISAILREKFKMEEKYEEIKISNKYSFAVCLDKDLLFDDDYFFFTASAYIRYKNMIPGNIQLTDFEQRLKEKITHLFNETDSDPKRFNDAVKGILNIFENMTIDKCSCCFKVVKSFLNESMDMHSFFTDDLKKAYEIRTDNLERYLTGKNKNRINLDCRDEDAKKYFTGILHPKRYPSGRFPGKTEFALSFMQQVAVNLACSKEKEALMSVNGPPGTGKTTLLKDIFAELAVKQALDICKMSGKTIGSKDKFGIGILPECIAEKNIVVASSNNGAVQNIVNELPLTSAIDKELLPELLAADYFTELSNSKVEEKFFNENGKWKSVTTIEPNEDQGQFWGMYSLEGGKKENVRNIIKRLKCIYRYLQDEYDEQPDIYEKFMREYRAVDRIREQAAEFSEKVQVYNNDCIKLEECREKYRNTADTVKNEYAALSEKYNDELKTLKEEYSSVSEKLSVIVSETEKIKSEKDQKYIEYRMAAANKPSLISKILHGSGEYESIKAGISAQIDLLDRKLDGLEKEEAQISSAAGSLKSRIFKCENDFRNLEKDYKDRIGKMENEISYLSAKTEDFIRSYTEFKPMDLNQDYSSLQKSNPWFTENFRKAQSKLFITALRVRKQFLYENRKNIKRAYEIWLRQQEYLENKSLINEAWHWINLTIPVISSTFASFSRMCSNLDPETMGHLFVDEAGQALPQAAVGAIFRSRYVMVVGDPFQIKPVLTINSSITGLLRNQYKVSENYLSDSASVQTLVDSVSKYGFYTQPGCDESPWIGIPLWVHRRCKYPMFTISNRISYNNLMVQGTEGYGKTGWFDIKGKAVDKYVKAQGDFLADKISELMKTNKNIADKNEKDVIYVITPFANVAYHLAQRLHSIGFTRYDASFKPTNVGTIHTFQGKEAPIVFMVLGADEKSRGAAYWAVSEPNMMNVAATRAKEEFYIIGDMDLYKNAGSDIADETISVIESYKRKHPDLVEETAKCDKAADCSESEEERLTGTVSAVRMGKNNRFAFVDGDDKIKYTIKEDDYAVTENAESVIREGNKVSFLLSAVTQKHRYISDVRGE